MKQPLTLLSPDKALFQSSVRQFARERLALLAREMDEKGVFRRELLNDPGYIGIAISGRESILFDKPYNL